MDGFQSFEEFGGGGVAIGRVKGSAALQDALQIAVIVLSQHAAHGDAQGVEVASRVGLPEAVLLRRSIAFGAEEFRVWVVALLDGTGDAEVEELHFVFLREHDIGGLEVAVDDVLLMEGAKAEAELFEDMAGGGFVQQFPVGQEVCECPAVDVFLDDDELPFLYEQAMDGGEEGAVDVPDGTVDFLGAWLQLLHDADLLADFVVDEGNRSRG